MYYIIRKLINAAPVLAKCSPPPHTRAAKFLYGGAAFSQKGGCIYQFPIIIIFPKKIHYKVHLTYESLFLLHMKRYHVSKKSFRFLCLDFGKKTSLMTCFLRFSNLKLSWQSYNPCESQEFPYQSYLKPVNCAMIGMHCSISSLLISKHSG